MAIILSAKIGFFGYGRSLEASRNGFKETRRKFTRYFFTTGCWDHGAAETVSRGCASIGEAIAALFFAGLIKGIFAFWHDTFLNA